MEFFFFLPNLPMIDALALCEFSIEGLLLLNRIRHRGSIQKKASSMGDQKCYGPNDPTMSMSIKTLLKNRLHILFNFFMIFPICLNFVWC